ncbi:MAG: AAA family ATPase, partial [Caldilineaceae bacterium]|nr:AAA family ATPase [Caldilineaceae bacterium]
LVLHPHAVPRRQISAALWPDVKESTGRNRLRNLLHQLRQLLPHVDAFLDTQPTTIGWREDAPCAIDVAHFIGALALAERHADPQQREQALTQAVDLYQGNLFPDCYDDWIAPLRTKFYNELLGAYEQLMALAEGRQDWSAAQRHAERSLAYDPLRESTYCRLMTFYAQQGDSAAVMETYRRCRAILARELDAAPSESTQALYSELTLGTRPVAADAIERMPRVVHSSMPTTRRPLIGRVVELHTLQWHWEQVQQGTSRLVVIQGEAGIGKSRLAAAFAHWAQQEGITVASAACYAVEGTLAYAPIAEWIRAEPIWQTLDGLEDIWLTEVARLVPEVQSRYAHLPPPAPMHESWQQQRFFTALAITMLEHGQPLVLLLDDLQWADDETFQWLHFLLRYESPTPLLVVVTLRTDDATERTRTQRLLHALTHQNLVEEITLAPLSIVDTAALAEHLMGRELFPPQVAQIFHETEGNPLFIVETVRAATEDPAYLTVPPVVDSGNAAPSRHLPPKVRSLIESRLARLSTTAAEMVQLAAVIGRRFAYPLLITVSGESEEIVLAGLEELWQQQLIREAGADRFGGWQEYDFTHDKVREVVYATLSPIRRRYLHRKVGEALSTHPQIDDGAFSGQSAAHFEAAGLFTQAVAHYHKAGQFSAGLYAFQRAEQAYANAVRLARQIDLPPATMRALYDERGRLRELSGDYGSAIAIYRELEALAKVQRDNELALLAIERLATCYTEPSSVHDRAAAAALLERGIQLAQTLADPHAEARFLRTRMVDLSHYGSDEEAVQIGEQALHVARTHGLTMELASILNDLAVPLRLSGQQEVAQRYASEARQLFRQSHTL